MPCRNLQDHLNQQKARKKVWIGAGEFDCLALAVEEYVQESSFDLVFSHVFLRAKVHCYF